MSASTYKHFKGYLALALFLYALYAPQMEISGYPPFLVDRIGVIVWLSTSLRIYFYEFFAGDENRHDTMLGIIFLASFFCIMVSSGVVLVMAVVAFVNEPTPTVDEDMLVILIRPLLAPLIIIALHTERKLSSAALD